MSSHHQLGFDANDRLARDHSSGNPLRPSGSISPDTSDLDVIKRDRFELLSAYLDGEVCPSDRRLVSSWLANDPETQCLYRRLLYLRQGFQSLCPPAAATQPPDILTNQVYQRLNQGIQRTCMASFAAVVLAVVGVFSGTISHRLGSVALSGRTPSMGQTALGLATNQGANGPQISAPATTVVSGSRMETLVQEVRSQSHPGDAESDL
ncbi:MAG: transcriptional regulator [Leptolyngbya sp. RL_3_1]|nr:transcriptional regulator [Leptolyngbya sp. RL_3_1]